MQIHWGNLIIGVVIGVAAVHLLARMSGGRIQQSPS